MYSTERPGKRWRSQLVIPPALRYPDYRNYWFGTLASVTGFQMFQFGQLWLIYELTESPLFLGYVGLAQAIPAIVLNLVGGVVADRFNRRILILSTQTLNATIIAILATLTLLGQVEVWHVLVIAFCSGAVNAFDQPARQAIYPTLITPSVMTSAVALNSAIWQGVRIGAPALAGFIISAAGTSTVFYLASAGFVVMAFVMIRLNVPPSEDRPRTSPVRDLVQGLKFIKDHFIFTFLIGMTFFNSFFGMSYMIMMPVFAVDILKVGAGGQGQLLGINGLGALLITLFLSSRSNLGHDGLRVIGGAVFFGIAVAAFAITSQFVGSFPLALTLMFIVGVCSSIYMIAIMTSLQLMVPDNMRGRVMGFYSMTWSIMPLGGMQAGAIANAIGAHWALVIGGAAVVLFALGPALLNPQVRNLTSLVSQFKAK
ncbi:MAG: MFS transporter [Dehalococcoidales bacterium]|nr:MAG: MFS transporter [Dehalococcoidales bacterium]